MSVAYTMGYELAKRAAALTADAGERLIGGKKEPGMAQRATKRVRKSILLKGREKIKPVKPRPPSPPNVPAAGTTGWGPR